MERPYATSLGYLLSAGVYEDKNAYPLVIDVTNLKIFRFEENIYYANVDVFQKLFIKHIDFRVDDRIKAMNNEIENIEREYKLRLVKPNRQIMKLKRYFQRNIINRDETGRQEDFEIDANKIVEEKHEEVKSIYIDK